ncbi:hypothetical protein PXV97_11090 [Citrobacter freundii]|nr:hypothetical protein PXV97_11090 [Citrobacter freundii]
MMIIHRGMRFIHPDRAESVRSPMPVVCLVYHKAQRERDLLITVNCADTLQTLHVVAGQNQAIPRACHSIKDKVMQDYLRNNLKVSDLVEKYRADVSRRTIYRWVKV